MQGTLTKDETVVFESSTDTAVVDFLNEYATEININLNKPGCLDECSIHIQSDKPSHPLRVGETKIRILIDYMKDGKPTQTVMGLFKVNRMACRPKSGYLEYNTDWVAVYRNDDLLKVKSRIFKNTGLDAILKEVLAGYDIQTDVDLSKIKVRCAIQKKLSTLLFVRKLLQYYGLVVKTCDDKVAVFHHHTTRKLFKNAPVETHRLKESDLFDLEYSIEKASEDIFVTDKTAHVNPTQNKAIHRISFTLNRYVSVIPMQFLGIQQPRHRFLEGVWRIERASVRIAFGMPTRLSVCCAKQS